MKSLFRAISDTSLQKRPRRKQRNTKNPSDLNTTMGACLDLQSEAPIKILLVPCESQPPSSTRYWVIDTRKRGKIPFFGSHRCKIVQHMGNRVSEPFQGHVLAREGQTIIKGILTDGAAEGKYFELVLHTSSQQLNNKTLGKTSGRTAALCGFLQRSRKDKLGTYEETHDAFLHSVGENNEAFQTKEKLSKFGQKKVSWFSSRTYCACKNLLTHFSSHVQYLYHDIEFWFFPTSFLSVRIIANTV